MLIGTRLYEIDARRQTDPVVLPGRFEGGCFITLVPLIEAKVLC
jgi:hypothetical protein